MTRRPRRPAPLTRLPVPTSRRLPPGLHIDLARDLARAGRAAFATPCARRNPSADPLVLTVWRTNPTQFRTARAAWLVGWDNAAEDAHRAAELRQS